MKIYDTTTLGKLNNYKELHNNDDLSRYFSTMFYKNIIDAAL